MATNEVEGHEITVRELVNAAANWRINPLFLGASWRALNHIMAMLRGGSLN